MLSQLEAQHTLFESVETMLAPETLSEILGRKVVSVRLEEMNADFSSNLLFRVQADEQSLVMKKLRPAHDWLAIGSKDTECRSVKVWQYGLLDRIQPHLDHARLAACQDGGDYGILMRDVSHGLFQDQDATAQNLYKLLDALAEMHSLFWEDDSLKDPVLGLRDLPTMITVFWPKNWDLFQHIPEIVATLTKGWDALFDLLEADSRAVLQRVMDYPQALFETLSSFPFTFRHGDFRLPNLALLPETQQVIAFDWQMSTYSPGILDVSWLLLSGEYYTMCDEGAAYYRQQLAARLDGGFDQSSWQAMLELAYLVDVVTKGPWHAFFAVNHEDEGVRNHMRRSVAMYNEFIHRGVTWL